MTGSAADLLAQARALEEQALEAGEDLPDGRTLRSRAAQLRVEALAGRPYPVATCTDCLRVTGWTGEGGRCDACMRRAQTHAAFTDPGAGFVNVSVNAAGPKRQDAPAGGGPHSLRRVFAGRSARDRARADAWLSLVDPDETGPIEPEEGFELEGARRDQVEALDRSGMVVRFRTATHRFADGKWTDLDTTRIPRDRLLAPAEHSAALETEALVAAWVDYKAEVEAQNREAWTQEAARRDAAGDARREHDEMVSREGDAFELLDEG